MHLRDQKKRLREAINERLARMNARDRERESRSLCRRLLKRIPEDATVCAYWPLGSEPDIRPVIEKLIVRGQRVFLPCFERTVVFREFTDTESLIKGELGIMEPTPDALCPPPSHINIVLVPGRGFDRACNRLGRSNGGYDLWIERQRSMNPSTQYWGIAYECQLAREVPMEAHDQRMDRVVTAREWIENR